MASAFTKLLWYLIKTGAPTPPAPSYRYIDPVDPDAFPTLYGYKLIHVGADFGWTNQLDTYNRILKRTTDGLSQSYAPVYSTVVGAGTPASHAGDKTFMIGGGYIARQCLPGEYDYETIVNEMDGSDLLYPLANSDGSVWKPALRESDGVTGYWNGDDAFIEVYGGIPYLGENLLTEEIIQNFYSAWINASDEWTPQLDGSTSILFAVKIGAYYELAWDETSTDIVGAIFRWGFTDTPTPSKQTLTNCTRTTPQEAQSTVVRADNIYMPMQIKGSVFPGNLAHLSVREMVGYQPPVLMMAPRPDPEEPEDPEDEGGEDNGVQEDQEGQEG